MKQAQTVITISTRGKGLVPIDRPVLSWVAEQEIGTGLLTLWCRHTSASLLINENAAPAVRRDLLRWLERIAPERAGYEHDDEGPDDMPAHIKAMLTGTSLTVPVMQGQPALGTWQGIFLAEHRDKSHHRTIALHIAGE